MLLKSQPSDMSARLRSLGITNILLAKEQDYEKYDWLNHSPGIQKTLQNDRLILYTLEDTR